MLGGWEAGKGKVVLRGNSFLMLKIVINGDIRLIHKYYPMPCNSGKHFMLKLLSVVEKRRPAPWGIPPPPPIGGIRASPPQHSPWERTRQQTAAPTFWPFTFDLDSRGEREGSWFFQTLLVSSSLWLPSTASAILRSSYHLLDNHHKVAEPLRSGAGKSKYRDADEPAKPREWELGGVYPQDERVISARLTRSGRNRTPPGLDLATRRAERVCSHGCVRMRHCACTHGGPLDLSLQAHWAICVCWPWQHVTVGWDDKNVCCLRTRADLPLDVLKRSFQSLAGKDLRSGSSQRSLPSLGSFTSSLVWILFPPTHLPTCPKTVSKRYWSQSWAVWARILFSLGLITRPTLYCLRFASLGIQGTSISSQVQAYWSWWGGIWWGTWHMDGMDWGKDWGWLITHTLC